MPPSDRAIFMFGYLCRAARCNQSDAPTAIDIGIVVIDYDCLKVVATGVRDCGSGAVSVAGLQVDSPQGCPKISEFEVVYYKDVDGIPGYSNPPDRYVDHRSATSATGRSRGATRRRPLGGPSVQARRRSGPDSRLQRLLGAD